MPILEPEEKRRNFPVHCLMLIRDSFSKMLLIIIKTCLTKQMGYWIDDPALF